MKIDLCTLDWVAVSAIATALMVIITLITLSQNRKQLKELKRQWEEQNKPKVIPSLTLGGISGGVYLFILDYSRFDLTD